MCRSPLLHTVPSLPDFLLDQWHVRRGLAQQEMLVRNGPPKSANDLAFSCAVTREREARARATPAATSKLYRLAFVQHVMAKTQNCRCALDKRRISPGSPVAMTAPSKSSG